MAVISQFPTWSQVLLLVAFTFFWSTSKPTTFLVRKVFGRFWFVELLLCMQCAGFWFTIIYLHSFVAALIVSMVAALVSEVYQALVALTLRLSR